MNRHTNSPIWCVALLLVACSDDAETEVHATPPDPATATATAGMKGAAATSDEGELATSVEVPEADALALNASSVTSNGVAPLTMLPEEIKATKASSRAPEVADAADVTDVDAGELRVITGFERPSAVLYDAASDRYLVSNLVSGADGAGPGYIARVTPEGELEAPRWIDGASPRTRLKTPRGMTIIRGRLYVADGSDVRVYDRKTGVPRGTIKVPGASQLNGLARGAAESLLVSDASYGVDGRPAGTDAVYRVNRAGRVTALFRSSVLGHPAGVLYTDKTVWIATQGSGKLHGLKANGALRSGPTLDEGRLTGIIEVGPGDVVVTSQVAQGLYRGSLTGEFSYLGGGIVMPGHPGWDPKRRRLLVPSEASGEVHVLILSDKETATRPRG
ncbi:MAG: hypothetical protein ACPGU1_16685 [Myxococcota bacterium]